MGKKMFIDVDRAIEVYNAKNEGKKPLNREGLAKELGVTYQSLVNYQGGRVPGIVGTLKKIVKKTGIDFKELVKTK